MFWRALGPVYKCLCKVPTLCPRSKQETRISRNKHMDRLLNTFQITWAELFDGLDRNTYPIISFPCPQQSLGLRIVKGQDLVEYWLYRDNGKANGNN